jgi:hypothetical protein
MLLEQKRLACSCHDRVIKAVCDIKFVNSMADFSLTPHENPSAPTISCKIVAGMRPTMVVECAAFEKPGQPAFEDVTATYCMSVTDKPGTAAFQQCDLMQVDCTEGKCVITKMNTTYTNPNGGSLLAWSEPTKMESGQPLYVLRQSLLQN